MFKILHGKRPASLKRLFNFKKESLQHNLCDSSNTLRLPKPCSNSVRVSCMMELQHGTLFLKSLETAKHILVLKRNYQPSLLRTDFLYTSVNKLFWIILILL